MFHVLLKLSTLSSKVGMFVGVSLAAIVLDEKTGISIGTLAIVGCGILYLGRKLQSLDDFVTESRNWRKVVTDEQAQAREERSQILRHQEIAKQRHEQIFKQLETIDESKKLYGELLLRISEMKEHLTKKMQ